MAQYYSFHCFSLKGQKLSENSRKSGENNSLDKKLNLLEMLPLKYANNILVFFSEAV